MSQTLNSFDDPWPDLNGKSVLVTGGTGSFGQAFVRVVLDNFQPARLIVFSRDEMKQYEMTQGQDGDRYSCMRYFIGDVRDVDRLEMAMRGVDIVIHAAALKHVPAAEYNPFECIHTNVMGAENIVKAAIRCRVEKIIALSTDKAANPINLYGASKLAADKIFVAANHLSADVRPRFSVVRYGNVLGSRGSVIPLFKRLIAEGADHLPITDDRMTRFWITLPQGVRFVLSSLAMMCGGEIFVPKIPSTKIVALAGALAPELPIRIIGIRPGEKLHEVLITEDDARTTLDLGDRYVIEPALSFWKPDQFAGLNPKPVRDGFRYGSDNNEDVIGEDGLRAILTGADK
jgi:UDP-N-acetylglucosamine 4,6-dehydratase